MDIGMLVVSSKQTEKGPGLVLAIHELFNESYADVYFENTGERRTIPASSLTVVQDPVIRLQRKSFTGASHFLLKYLLEMIQAESTREPFQAAGDFKILPLPHQLLAVHFVLGQFNPRVMIADEVGLGKTIEAALIYEELKARGTAKRVLIIAPSGLCLQWQQEMREKFFEDFVIYDRSTVNSLKQLHGETTNVWKISERIITSIDFIKPRRENDALGDVEQRSRTWHRRNVSEAAMQAGFDLVIFDEAHKLTKGLQREESARYKIGKALAETAPFLLLLTATPHQGDSAKFLYLLNLLDPYLFYRQSDVTPEAVKQVTVRNNKRAVVDMAGNRIFKQRLTSLCVLRRDPVADCAELDLYQAVTEYVTTFYGIATKENNWTMMFLLLIYQRMVSSSSRAILKSLTKRLAALETGAIEEGIPLQDEEDRERLDEASGEELARELEQQQGKAVISQEANLSVELAMLKHCVELARHASIGRHDAKFRKLLELVDEFKTRENSPTLKFIIFTEFVETQAYLAESLQHMGYAVSLINGGLSADEKIIQRDAFREKNQFLISTDAGGEGVNLQFCRIMINYDLPWNPMRLEQRIGRIDRIGQPYDVKVVNFQLADTVEQRVRDVIENKLDIIRREFQDGEDKMADIMSTLQDEFDFEKIYVDAVLKREQESLALNDLAQRIYERARQILREEELVLPFTDWGGKNPVTQRQLERAGIRAKQLLQQYLATFDAKLAPHRHKEGAYAFVDPRSGKRMQNVIFEQKYALNEEEPELLSLRHPYMEALVKELTQALFDTTSAKLTVQESKFSGEQGVLFVYRLAVRNYVDAEERYILPIFIGTKTGEYVFNRRISNYFETLEVAVCRELMSGQMNYDTERALKLAENAVRLQAEEKFLDVKNRLRIQGENQARKFEKYYSDKKMSVERIAVDNIRIAKLKELEEDYRTRKQEWTQRSEVVPELQLIQAGYVEFCG